ncbi:SDR family NAD(P)-dependent oxidoreductase [Streptacidiphilus cavernicola]|uniref:SDR family NAD(P)-dependent oxidoreductase n=1 Tax=Streptacidiphilus cavernicola TaxID=3342716 RepID=A0ABV6VSY2_9ACTN
MTGKAGRLHGKVLLVTGASSGIGAAAARICAAEGAKVVLVARRGKRLDDLAADLVAQGAEALPVVADVTRPEQTLGAVRAAVERYGRLDGAFNNAGYGEPRSPLHLLPEASYDAIMDVNVRGVWNCLRAQIPALLAAGGGSVVNTSSVGGLVATPVAAPYVAAKHAVIGLTRAAAAEYGTLGIRVNALAPGATRTEMLDDWIAACPEVGPRVRSTGMLQRTAAAEEVARVAAWLLSDEASFVTGAVVPVDGGAVAL